MIKNTIQKYIVFILLLINILFVGQSDVFNDKAFAQDSVCDDILSFQTEALAELQSTEITPESFSKYNADVKAKLLECANYKFEQEMISRNITSDNYNDYSGLDIFGGMDKENSIQNLYSSTIEQTQKELSSNINNNIIEQTIFNEFDTQLAELKETTDKIKRGYLEAKNIHQGNAKDLSNKNMQCI